MVLDSAKRIEKAAPKLELVDSRLDACEEIVSSIVKVLSARFITFLSRDILIEEMRSFQAFLEEIGLPPKDVGGIAFLVWSRIDATSNGQALPEVSQNEAVARVIDYVENYLDPVFLAALLKKKYRKRFPFMARTIGLFKGNLTKRFQAVMTEKGLDLEDMQYIGQRVYQELLILVDGR